MTLDATLLKNFPDYHSQREQIGAVMIAYEQRKKARKYLDYDDILAVVAHAIRSSAETRAWVASHYDHILVDEMQDTNPLQWNLLDPIKNTVMFFCVGDDAQSIYGFRGADFQNVHSFGERVPGAKTLKLERNYRSTQEILDVSNWLLSESTIDYGKELVASRGVGSKPQLHTFLNEWEEGRWIAEDLCKRRFAGSLWKEHMILVRASFAARTIEASLLAKEIPYQFIGGTKLMESAHVRDLLSALRVVVNPQDEIGWMRFLTLWNGVGEVIANRALDSVLEQPNLDACIESLRAEAKIPQVAVDVISTVKNCQGDVSEAIKRALSAMEMILAEKYSKQDWDKRKRDFRLVEKLAIKHNSILEFIEEYMLDPVYGSHLDRPETDDAVVVITIHSAKGTEREICYVVNASPGAYPSKHSVGDLDDVEEERRVLYVALTRAKNELIVTRYGYRLWAMENQQESGDEGADPETYFLNTLPEGLFDEHFQQQDGFQIQPPTSTIVAEFSVGISLGF